MNLPATPPAPTILIDSREQLPLDFPGMVTQAATLATGDYSAVGLERIAAIERKSLVDLLGCVGRDRDRFERELQRLLAYRTRAIVVEASWANLEAGDWRSGVTPASAVGSVTGWIAAGVPVVMAGDRARAARVVADMLRITHRRYWRQLRKLADSS